MLTQFYIIIALFHDLLEFNHEVVHANQNNKISSIFFSNNASYYFSVAHPPNVYLIGEQYEATCLL